MRNALAIELRRLEESLLKSSVRSSKEALFRLLAKDFVELYFNDPDGAPVQLEETEYRG